MNKASKIRDLLKRGETVQTIARKLKVKTNYVYQVRWHDKAKKVARVGWKDSIQLPALNPELANTDIPNADPIRAKFFGVGIPELIKETRELENALLKVQDLIESLNESLK